RIIFNMYASGHGYSAIMDALNSKGHRTKVGRPFGKNSLHEILKNEKYCGVYVYNKTRSADASGKFNRHQYKPPDQIIRIDGGLPAIISKDRFAVVQALLKANQYKAGRAKAKVLYLLSGKVFCGHCGQAMTGETRRYCGREYGYYICNNRKRTKSCDKKPIDKAVLEARVIDRLNKKLFSAKNIDAICNRIYETLHTDASSGAIEQLNLEIAGLDRKIHNISLAIADGTYAPELRDTLNALSEQKKDKLLKLCELEAIPDAAQKSYDELREAFFACADLALVSPEQQKEILRRLIYKVFVYDLPDGVHRIRIIIAPSNVARDMVGFLDVKGNAPSPPRCFVKRS
ncbi:MAG: recombinase family protein, partial [Acetanaerobacterium sp.]